jgi:hypothetical protein
LDSKRELLVEPVHFGVSYLSEEVVQLGGHPIVIVTDLPAHVAEVD